MIRILPIASKATLKNYNEINNVQCQYGYEITEGNVSLGYCLFSILDDSKYALIQIINTDDKMLFDGVVRAVMAFILDKGIDVVKFDDTVDQDLLTKCLFVTDTTNTINSIEKFFSKKCSNN